MKHVLTALLGAVVVALLAHLGLATLQPQAIQAQYPEWIARHYAGRSGAAKRDVTVRLEPVEGRPGVSRVVLSALAVEKIGIHTAEVAVQPVARTRKIGSVVLAGASLPATAPAEARASGLVAVVALSSRSDTPEPKEPAEITPLNSPRAAGAPAPPALPARLVGIVAEAAASGSRRTAYYALDGSGNGIEPGDFVMARIPLLRNGAASSVIPETAVLYEPTGTAWVYANPAPLIYVREPIDIEMTMGSITVLRRGPPAGTRIVTVGAFELYGSESAIGIEKVGH